MDLHDLPPPLQLHSVLLQTVIKHRGPGHKSPLLTAGEEQPLPFHRAAGAPDPH